jgi:hypothetical protein
VVRGGIFAVICLLATAVAASALSDSPPPVQVDAQAWPMLAVSTVLSGRSTVPPSVLENGAPARVVDARPVGRGDTVALVVDHSQSMLGNPVDTALAIARRLLGDEPRSARIAVFAVASTVVQKTGFSQNRGNARAALAGIGIDPRYGTRLYDSVAVAAHALESAGGRHKVLILITDGQETTSATGWVGAAEAADAAGVAVLPIGVADWTYEPDVLATLARATRGAFIGDPTRSPSQAGQAADDVRRTWRIDYLTSTQPGDRVKLSISQPGSTPVKTDLTIPGAAPAKSFFARNQRTLVIVGVAAAIVLIVLGLAGRSRASRSWVF